MYNRNRRLFSNRNVALAAALTLLGTFALLASRSGEAATPNAGTVTEANTTANPLVYSGGPFVVENKTALAGLMCGPAPANPCDDFQLTVNVGAGQLDTHEIRVSVQWPNPPGQIADFDVFVYKQNGGTFSDYTSSASSSDPEVFLLPAVPSVYRIRVVPFTPLGQGYTATITYQAKAATPPQSTGLAPKFQNYVAPYDRGLGLSAGEPSIGFNSKTGNIMFQSGLQTLRARFNDSTVPATVVWEDKSAANAFTTLDPILFTDPQTGRTITSQLSGTTSLSSFSDNDGDLWIPNEGGGMTSGVDHQTIGGGRYAGLLARDPNGPVYPNAIYYCSQDLYTAFCARSDNGGATYGPTVPVYTTLDCGGIHGHVKVGPNDGTVYVPNRQCGPHQGLVLSEDNGITWTVRQVVDSDNSTNNGDSLPGEWDPSVGIGKNGTVYFGYKHGDGTAHIAVSRDKGRTWSYDQNVGRALNIRNIAFPTVVAGDDNRAAFAFLGTDKVGSDPTAIWHLYIATTYDGGQSYLTVDATPSDPVQIGSICAAGISCSGDRNLLDFIDATIDAQGRVLVAYADGCVGCTDKAASTSALATIARQSCGRPLIAQFDTIGNCSVDPVPVPTPSPAGDACNGMAVVNDPAGDAINPAAGGAASGTADQADITVVGFAVDAAKTTLTTKMTIKNLSLVPVNGATSMAYITTWVGPNGLRYATMAQLPSAGGPLDFMWGEFDGEFLQTINFTTGRVTTGPNGFITVDVPLSGLGNPAIPVADSGSAPAVSNVYAQVTAGEGPILGGALIFTVPVDRAPTFGYGSRWAVCSATGTPTTTTLTSAPNPSNAGQAVAFTATVTGAGGVPTGDVAFNDGGNVLGTAALNGSGQATFTTSSLGGGSHSITAAYGGDANFAASTSGVLTQVVNGQTPPSACTSAPTQVGSDGGGDQGATNPSQLDVRAISVSEDYTYINSQRLVFTIKVDNLNTVPANGIWRARWRFTPSGGTDTTYYVSMLADANSIVSYEYGTISGNLLTSVGSIESGSFSADGTITLAIAMAKVGGPSAGSVLKTIQAVTQQNVQGTLFTGVDSSTTSGDNPSYTVKAKDPNCTPVPPPPPPGSATYVKGGLTFSPNYALRAAVASRDGEPSLRVDRLGNTYVAGIRGVPAGVDLWYFDLNPSSPTYDPFMRNPIYRGQPDQFSPDEAMEVGADGGGDVDMAVGFDEANPGQPPYLAFSSLVLANVSTARSTDRGASFVKNPAGNVTGGIPVDDRQWMEFYGKDSVYLLYRTVSPVIAYVQRSIDGGLTYGPARLVGSIGQVGGIDVDQNDGTVYISGRNGVVAVGVPPAPGLEPLTYTVYNAAGAGNGNIFFTVKVADDGTAYVCYSNGTHVFVKYSRDKGKNWSAAIRISDGPETATSLLPWMETGPVPGSIGVTWYGSTASGNTNDADWKVFFAQSMDITAPTPTIRQVQVSDHFIHGSNVSLAGLPLDPTQPSGNRNLIDYFQIGFDPTGAAVIAFTDDHNDFDGHTYVARQISGPSISGGNVPTPVEGANLPAAVPAGPKPSAESVGGIPGSQVTDFRHDVRTSNAALDIDDPFDVLSIKYGTEEAANGTLLVATMKVSDLSIIPPNGTWRINFTANAPGTALSPTGDYNFGLSDRGDQFFLRAATDVLGAQSFVYGKTERRHFVAGGGGGFDYLDLGAADGGSFDAANDTVTVKIALSKLNAALPAGHAPIGPGSVLAGLRGSAFTAVQGNSGRTDSTRGGTIFRFNSAPFAALSAVPTSGPAPLAVTFDASGSTDPDPGDSLSFTYDFGDGSSAVTQTNPVASHTYNQVGTFTARVTVTDAAGMSSSAQLPISVSNPPPSCLEDDDASITYTDGWHLVTSAAASAGHFRYHSGKSPAHSARVAFTVPQNSTGVFKYRYGKSTKGGTAEVFIDGLARGTISYKGNAGSNKAPEFQSGGQPYEALYDGLAPGAHTFELRNMADAVFVDGFCLEITMTASGGGSGQASWSSSQSSTGPGQTQSADSSIAAGKQLQSTINLGSSVRAISIAAETTTGAPIKLVLVNPSGLTVQVVDAVNGIAVLNAPVTQEGLYTIRTVNVNVGPVQVWTVATPTVAR